MSLQHLYTELLNDRSNPLGDDLQRRILAHARAHDNDDLLRRLLRRDDLVEDVDLLIGESRQLEVLVPWLLRNGRDHDILLNRLAREQRVTVLTALADVEDLPQAVYQVLAANRSEKVLKAVLLSRGADTATRRQAVRSLVSRDPRPAHWTTIAAGLRDLLDAAPAPAPLWDEVGLHARSLPYVLAVMRYATPTEDHLAHWIAHLESMHDTDGSRWRDLTGAVVTEIAARSLTREQHRELLHACSSILFNAEDASGHWASELSHARQALLAYDIETEERIRRLAGTANPRAASDLLAELQQHCSHHQLQRLLETAVANPVIPVDETFALRDDMTLGCARRLVTRLRDAGRDDLLHTWLDEHHSWETIPVILTELPDTSELLQNYLCRVTESGRYWPAWALETREVRRHPVSAVEHLPWEILTRKASSVPGLAAVVAARLRDTLGADDERWQTFTTIGADFGGTLDELLLVVSELSL